MATTPRQLLTAADVARCCRVDIKTIHNWAARGELTHFRTPGRHLRFQRADVLDFLRRYGYPVPDWLVSGPPSVALYGPVSELDPLHAALSRDFVPTLYSDPLLLLVQLGAHPPDAAVLVHAPSPSGLNILDVARALRRHGSTQQVRLVTVGPPDTSGLHLGVSAHLPKPDVAAVHGALAALLGTPRITD